MRTCLICNAEIAPFLSFGKMPIANGFLTPDQFDHEYFFELKVAFCPQCSMVQLTELVDREKLFHDRYPFFSSTSSRMAEHFKEFSGSVMKHLDSNSDPFVMEIGSNDGIMLRHFAASGIRHLGIEPSANVAAAARRNGVQTICRFFDETLAREILSEYGQIDAFLGANVMCHIPDLHSVLEGVRILLKPHGLLIFEDPYIGDMFEKTAYDQIYDEHAYYFSVSSIFHLMKRHGLEVVDIQPQNVHGGSMRYVIAPAGRRTISKAVHQQLAFELHLGLRKLETYEKLRSQIEHSRESLICLLQDLKARHKRVVGYGATSKSTTVINFCGINSNLVEFISDTTPIKQGKFSPGAHIPVQSHEFFSRSYPDYALLFAWNHREEILTKEQKFLEAGGKFIVYVPEVKIIQ